MNENIVLAGYAVIVAMMAVGYARLRSGAIRLRNPVGDLGAKGSIAAAAETEQRKLMIAAFLTQQRWSFGLLWCAVAVGLCLAVAIVSRLAFAPSLDLKSLAEAIGIAADLFLGSSAWKLYREATGKLEQALA